MNKKVLTYSWLAKRAMALFNRNRSEYDNLVGRGEKIGTEALASGATISWDALGTGDFIIRDRGTSRQYARIGGYARKDVVYSHYSFHFSASQYRKRITEKFFPISLPAGVKCYTGIKSGTTEAIFYNADGTESSRGCWNGGRRGRSGWPSLRLVIRDSDGLLMSVNDQGRLNLVGSGDDMISYLGWFPGASKTRTEWLDSIKAIPEGMCDHKTMLSVAARTYLAATRLAQKHPGMRVALFPAGEATDSSLQRWRHSQSLTAETVMGRHPSGDPILWHLPEVLMYWPEDVEGFEWRPYTRVSMTVPPHGSPSLDPAGKASPISGVVRHGTHSRWGASPPLPMAYEQAYHSLICFSPDVKPSDRRNGISTTYHFEPYPTTSSYSAVESLLTVWPQHKDKVMVIVLSKDCVDEQLNLPMEMDTPVAMTPEAAAGMFEEKMLLDTLPLC